MTEIDLVRAKTVVMNAIAGRIDKIDKEMEKYKGVGMLDQMCKTEKLNEELLDEAWDGVQIQLPVIGNAVSVKCIRTEGYELVILPVETVDESFFMVLGK